MKAFVGRYFQNGKPWLFNITAKSLSDAVTQIEGSQPDAIWIDDIRELP